AAQAEIVREASVHQMEIRVFRGVVELSQLLQSLQDAPGRPGWSGHVGELPQPPRLSIATRPAIVVDGERRQDDRHRGRGGGRASRKVLRSAHITSKFWGMNTTREPVVSSVALTAILGPAVRLRSANVAPLKRSSS